MSEIATDYRRQQLKVFLKDCRARIKPASVGLPEGEGRRSAGLRREDVAALADVSVTWYSWLEQGRDIRVSVDVLDRIAAALRLSSGEREYLFSLVQGHSAPPLPEETEVPEALQRMLDTVPFPGLIMTERWEIVAWNDLNSKVFFDFSKQPEDDRNFFRLLMLNEQYRQSAEDYGEMAKNIVSKFRFDYSQSADTEGFRTLIDELNETCPTFKRLWQRPDLSFKTAGVGTTRHPQLGGIAVERSTYVPEGYPTLRVLFLVPYDSVTARKFRQLQQLTA